MNAQSPYRFVILGGKNASKTHEREYAAAYETFKLVWSKTLDEVADQRQFFSDEFTRQDYLHCLFAGDVCAGLTCLKAVDLKYPAHREDSYFRYWNPEHFDRISAEKGSLCLVNCHFTMHPDYRKTGAGEKLPPSQILGCLSVLHQMELDYPYVLATMRNDRSMNKLAEYLGAVTIEKDVRQFGIASDLVVFFNENIRMAQRKFPSLVNDIYQLRENAFQGGTYEIAA